MAKEVKGNKPGYPKGKIRPSKADVIVRVDNTEKLLSQGLRSQDVIDLLREEYNIVERTARNYIYKALQRWEADTSSEAYNELRNAKRIEMRTELWKLYELARQDKKYKDSVLILDRVCKLDGLYEAEKLDISVSQGVMIVSPIQTETTWLDAASKSNKELED
jgi:arginine/lysine/ornithine decarboxylase